MYILNWWVANHQHSIKLDLKEQVSRFIPASAPSSSASPYFNPSHSAPQYFRTAHQPDPYHIIYDLGKVCCDLIAECRVLLRTGGITLHLSLLFLFSPHFQQRITHMHIHSNRHTYTTLTSAFYRCLFERNQNNISRWRRLLSAEGAKIITKYLSFPPPPPQDIRTYTSTTLIPPST